MIKYDNLIIIIYSDLAKSGGGRETWLAQFLNNERILNSFNYFHVISATSINESSETIDFNDEINVH
ncbi:hypothetical protein CXF80_19980, partial [Shewanella sp. Actino-trap-3]|uniref:hypothetical protein n=1 Tax=Shewanella sp. Actino-trap-3 TaxID=2058331 RepID=UPI000CC5455C